MKYMIDMEYYDKENLIKFCPHCGSNIFYEKIKDQIDYIITEKSIICKNCNNQVNYWSYGYYENIITLNYLKILRNKKIERCII